MLSLLSSVTTLISHQLQSHPSHFMINPQPLRFVRSRLISTMSVSAPPSQGPHHPQGPYHPPSPVPAAMAAPSQIGNLGPLRYQLEFYFSPQNLAKDNYLLAQLNSPEHPGAVPMGLVCSFPKVRQINALIYNMGHLSGPMAPIADPNLVRLALHQSSVVTVSADGAWLLPVDSSVWLNAQHRPSASTKASPVDGKIAASSPSSPSSQATASSSLGVPTHPLPPPAEAGVINPPAGTHSNVVVVYYLPDKVTADDLIAEFRVDDSAPPSARSTSAKSVWEVVFPNEASARQALAIPRDRIILGASVHAVIKSEIRPDLNEMENLVHRATNPGMPAGHSMQMGYPVSLPIGYPFAAQPTPQMAFYGYTYPMPHQMPMAVPHQAFYNPQQGFNPGMIRNTHPAQGRPPPAQTPGMNGGRQNYAPQARNNNGQRNDRGPGLDASGRRNMVKNWQPKNSGTRIVGKHQPDSGSLLGQQPKEDGGNRQGHKNRNNNNRNPQRQQKDASLPVKEYDARIDLGADNFPALSGKPVAASADRSFSVATGYAAALRKNATPSQTPPMVPNRALDSQVPDFKLDEAASKRGSHE